MREMIWRGKEIKTGQWVCGDGIILDQFPCNSKIYMYSKLEKSFVWVEVDNATIGEYTGLKDKNGKKIYEGDIIMTFLPEINFKKYGVVEFIEGSFKITWKIKFWGQKFVISKKNDEWEIKEIKETEKIVKWEKKIANEQVNLYVEADKCEVIGNIYENPELLKGGKNGND